METAPLDGTPVLLKLDMALTYRQLLGDCVPYVVGIHDGERWISDIAMPFCTEEGDSWLVPEKLYPVAWTSIIP